MPSKQSDILTPKPSRPWWKQRRIQCLLGAMFLIGAWCGILYWHVQVDRWGQACADCCGNSALDQCGTKFFIGPAYLKRVEVFKYLGRMFLAQDDDDIQAVRAQLRKARAVWARVGQVLRLRS
jgi:hypothetical protein